MKEPLSRGSVPQVDMEVCVEAVSGSGLRGGGLRGVDAISSVPYSAVIDEAAIDIDCSSL